MREQEEGQELLGCGLRSQVTAAVLNPEILHRKIVGLEKKIAWLCMALSI